MIYTCSNCKQSYDLPDGQKMNNCPNCGNPFVSGVMTTLSHNPLPFSGGYRRGAARLLDYHLEVICLLIPYIGCKVHGIATLFGEPLLDAVIMGASLGFMAFLLDGIVFSIFGNTLGKFLFGVKVINTARGTLISKEEYFKRNFLVFIQGCGLCIHLVSLIMVCIQLRRVCSKPRRPTTYDAKSGYDVVLFKNSTVKSFFGIVLFIGVTWLCIGAMLDL